MGSCICRGAPTMVVSRENLQRAIAGTIEEDRVQSLQSLFENYMSKALLPYAIPVLDVDDPLVHIQDLDLNALAYAFRLGRVEIAQFLIEKANSSLAKLYQTYKLVGKTPVDILCEHGHIDLLHYFLPKHIKRPAEESPLLSYEDSYEQLSIFADKARVVPIHHVSRTAGVTYTAVQRACEHGQLEIVRYITSYTREEGTTRDLDVHAEDEKTGENCALISCCLGDLALIRFLHEECRADFKKLNKRGESAIQMAVVGAKKHKLGKHYEAIKFLVEKIKVDLLYHYEETLLMCEDKAIAQYLEGKLRNEGVQIDKSKLEVDIALCAPLAELEEAPAGTNFLLGDLFREEFAKKSYPSSIAPQSCTPISRLSSPTPTLSECNHVE